ncbi:hypothetical protein AtubIFM55763_011152 [Aspergillus tubingensis]|uniref:Uncharacterized protein n=4 Tax=Aspergillus subgen. Circumdati TaxID=2720871 RepID=A0A8G1R1P1_9EURO|nr:hypothetical protein BO87DRAFT_308333 [Aspergillus neoniger CBS 115656]XP_025515540.1 hypothetical protein BO85DRAFT_307242 [Aspergillus piperis CBS 112811]XP_035357454.1 uncharacterized protein AtWU_06452 [Aspergillus tubingensis]OJZ80998.1 hypothetical protein ASPFODRAFT_146608 [Aspergillus luchuensis CBS 106.47]BCS15898.1 hypothetical protein ALUC_80105S [Aspergillus luchuensis]GAA84084.1 similar to An11g01180 [Aspergillus luchuensis IFO 4308]PYH34240.1 hypothetical protein BO87DRAFT_30
MSKRRLFRWPARRTAGLGCLALLVTSMVSWYLYGTRPYEPQPVHQETPNNDHDIVTSQLAQLTSTYSNATNDIGLVLAATVKEDLTWLLNYCKDHGSIPFIYTTDQPPAPYLLVPRTIRGREAAAYLSFVVDFYHQLPKYTIFIHSNLDQWHNDLFGPHTSPALKNLRLEAVDAQGYVNLRCEHDPGCPTSVHPWSPTQIDIEKDDIRAFFPEVYETILGVPAEKVPEHIGNVCCGQFAVSRERILERPREDYERMLKWAEETELTDSFGVGWVYEKIWHIIFGMDVIYCPRYEQCRCDTYGWCGPLASGETLQAVRAKKS